MPIIVKSVGVTTYGGFVLLTSVLGIAFGISSFGAGFRARRLMPSAKTMSERAELFYPQFYFNILVISILSLLFVLLEEELNTYLLRNEVSFSIWIMPLYLVSYFLFSQGSDYFRYTSRVHLMTLAGLCFPCLHIGFTVLYLYIYGSININMLVISLALSALLTALSTCWVILREISARISLYSLAGLVSDIKLGFPLILSYILDFILAGSDRYLIAFYLSVTDVGYYVPGYVLGSSIILLPKALGTALPQLLSRAVDGGKEFEARTMVNYAIKIFLLLAIPFIFGSFVLSKPLLTLLANQQVAERAFLVAPIVALGTLFYGLTLLFSNVLFVRLKANAMFRMNLIAALLNLLGNLVLLYFFRNLLIAAATTFLSYAVAFLYTHRIVAKEWPIHFEGVSIAKSVAASAIMAAVISLLMAQFENHFVGILLVPLPALGIVIYAGCLFGFNTFSQKEILFLRNLVH